MLYCLPGIAQIIRHAQEKTEGGATKADTQNSHRIQNNDIRHNLTYVINDRIKNTCSYQYIMYALYVYASAHRCNRWIDRYSRLIDRWIY